MDKYLIINASLVTNSEIAEIYEFVIDQEIGVIDCGRVSSLASMTVRQISEWDVKVANQLFEINHVRINPKIDNTDILDKFCKKLTNFGVEIYNAPQVNDMRILYNPVGELSTIVRFYMKLNKELVFLVPTVKLKIANI